MQWNKDFDWLTQAAVTDLTAWFWSCSLVYISRSGTHGFSSATRLSNVATSGQLCTHEQIQSHHSTSLLKQRYQKPLIQSIPFHDIFFHMFYTGYPLVNHTVILKWQLLYTTATEKLLEASFENFPRAPCLHERTYEPGVLKQRKRSCIYIYGFLAI